MTTKSELAVQALQALVSTALPAITVLRNDLDPLAIGAGLASVRDGDLGEPEETLGVRTYYFEQLAEVELFTQDGDAATRTATLNGWVETLTAAIIADRTLGGAVDWAEPRLAIPAHDPVDFAEGGEIARAVMTVTLSFQGSGPTG